MKYLLLAPEIPAWVSPPPHKVRLGNVLSMDNALFLNSDSPKCVLLENVILIVWQREF